MKVKCKNVGVDGYGFTNETVEVDVNANAIPVTLPTIVEAVIPVQIKDGEWEWVELKDMEIGREYNWCGEDMSLHDMEGMSFEEACESGVIVRIE